MATWTEASETRALERCEGYDVESPAGKVGVVDAVLFGEDASRPAALAIRSGRLGRALRIVDAGEIELVDARARRVTVRSEGSAVSF